jgi:hypothetical protein
MDQMMDQSTSIDDNVDWVQQSINQFIATVVPID